MSRAMKRCIWVLCGVKLSGVGAFAAMVTFPQVLPASWAGPSVPPSILSPEEVEASCCERVKLKWRDHTCPEGTCP